MNKLFTKKRKGFTLIELIVVIAILGILAAIAVPRLSGSRDRAAQAANKANARTLHSAAMLYLAEKGNPASDLTAITAGTEESPGILDEYIQKWPVKPKGIGKESDVYTVDISSAGVVVVKLGSTAVDLSDN